MRVLTNKLKYLIKISLNKKIKTKWFVIVNILLVLLVIGMVNLDTIISAFGGDFNEKTNVIVKDNTNEVYDLFKTNLGLSQNYLTDLENVNLSKSEETREKLIEDIDSKDVVIIINNDDTNTIKAEIISDQFVDTVLYQTLTSAINSSKITLSMSKSNIDPYELASINAPVDISRNILDETKEEEDEHKSFFMGIIFPSFILPFFMLIIFLVQMIGGEINEEKTTRSMEIIISNVSPKTHFFSKIIASNIFILLQVFILFIAGLIGILIRKYTAASSFSLGSEFDLSSIWNTLVSSGVSERLIYVIPITIILMFLSFLAYSLIAGILASMTTSIEDFQQVQTPIILICLFGYYLSMLAPTFEGSIFIKIVSYLPFISVLISPPLLLLGQIGLIDALIAIAILSGTIYLMLKYGMKIYKVGILNYSTTKIWGKMFKAIKD